MGNVGVEGYPLFGAYETDAAIARGFQGGERMVGKAVRIALLGCASVPALVVGRTAIAGEVTITFVRIVDTDTPVPFLGGATGEVTFDSLGAPTVDDGLVAFYGYLFPSDPDISGEGVYTYHLDDGTFHLVADGLTPFPDGVGNIVQFSTPCVGASSVTFTAWGLENQHGIYTASGAVGQLDVVADRSTPDPDGNGVLREFFTLSRSGTSVGFVAITSTFVHGVYAHVGGVRLVANTLTPIPGGKGLFLAFGFNVTISNTVVAFLGDGGADYSGIFTGTLLSNGGSSLKVVADTGTLVPGGTGTFTLFSDRPSIGDGQVAFWGRGDAGQEGIYATRGGLHRVADLSTLVPDGVGTFTAFGYGGIGSPYGPSMSTSGRVVFRGEGAGGQVGLYVEIGASLHKVVDLDEQLDDEVSLVSLFLEPECQDGNLVGFVAGFSDSSSAVYLAAVSLLGDLDGDDSVGVTDLLILLGSWGPCPDPCAPACPADLDGDCLVGVPDLLTLLANWG